MKYKVTNLVAKQGKTGKTYYQADFTGEDGVTVKATTFDVITENGSYEGELTVNGSFTNFKVKMENKGNFGPSRGNPAIKQAMETKNTNIKEFTARKENAITLAGTARDATLLTVAMLNQPNMMMDESDVKAEWKMWRKFLLEQMGDMADITETKQPF